MVLFNKLISNRIESKNMIIDNNVIVSYSGSTLVASSVLGISCAVGSGIISRNKFGNNNVALGTWFGDTASVENDGWDYSFFANTFVNSEGKRQVQAGTCHIGGFLNASTV